MKNHLIILTLLILACHHEEKAFQLEKGDLLFQDLDSSPLCDAIEIVTPGYKNSNFSHIGVVIDVNDPYCNNPEYIYEQNIRVLEAIPKTVKTTRLDSFLNRSFDINNNPKVIVGRLKPKYRYLIDDAINFMSEKLGVKYDDEFLINNDMYYCSELIYEAFEKDTIFQLQPMTFLHPESNETIQTWTEYYSKLNIDIPEGKLGINPGTMSISNNIEIVHIYGIPSGMQK